MCTLIILPLAYRIVTSIKKIINEIHHSFGISIKNWIINITYWNAMLLIINYLLKYFDKIKYKDGPKKVQF